MNELNEYRNELDLIDNKMKELFLKRMDIVRKISQYKKINNISITDSNREQEMFERLLKGIEDEYKEYYHNFLLSTINISKDYQKNNL